MDVSFINLMMSAKNFLGFDKVNLGRIPQMSLGMGLINGKAGTNVPYFVNMSKPGDGAWVIAYRDCGAGALPANAVGFDTLAFTKAIDPVSNAIQTDNTKAFILVYQHVLDKNIAATFKYQDIKAKDLKQNSQWTQAGLTKTYQLRFDLLW